MSSDATFGQSDKLPSFTARVATSVCGRPARANSSRTVSSPSPSYRRIFTHVKADYFRDALAWGQTLRGARSRTFAPSLRPPAWYRKLKAISSRSACGLFTRFVPPACPRGKCRGYAELRKWHKVLYCQLVIMVPRGGIEPPTLRFSD
jgi:hypothetical protein